MENRQSSAKTVLFLLTISIGNMAWSQVNNALHFDAVDDRVVCGTDASLNITGNGITVEAWIKPSSFGTNFWSGNIVNKEDAAWSGYMLRCGANAQLNFAIGDGFDWYETTSSANALVLNAWQHVAATYDGATVRLYVNGAQVASMAQGISIGPAVNPLVLGDWNVNSNHRFYHGAMDEVRIWNTPLDAATIAANYAGTYCGPQPGLVAYYKFDQGVGGGDNTGITTLADEAGPNTGSLSGFGLTGSTSNFIGGVVLGTQVSAMLCPDASYSFNGQTLTEPGTYTASFPVPGSCDSTVVLTLSATTVNVGVAQNGHLLISQANGAQYQWINCLTGAAIPNATGQYYQAPVNGQFAVIVTQNACSDTSACFTVTTAGLEETGLPQARVWPQPVSDRINVELEWPLSEAVIRVHDITGRMVMTRAYALLHRTSLGTEHLPAGAYLLVIEANGEWKVSRFTKE